MPPVTPDGLFAFACERFCLMLQNLAVAVCELITHPLVIAGILAVVVIIAGHEWHHPMSHR